MKRAKPMNEEAVEVVRLYNEAWLNRDLVAMERYLAADLVLWHNHIRQEFDKPTMMKFVGDALLRATLGRGQGLGELNARRQIDGQRHAFAPVAGDL